MRKYVILADCEADEIRSIADELVILDHKPEIESVVANWKRTGKLSEIKRYATYFLVGFRAFIHRQDYAAIVGWQQFYALIFCFFCSIFHVKKTTTVVALNFTYKEKRGMTAGLYRWFMEKCVSVDYLDHIHVLSDSYANEIAKTFNFPRSRILVTGFGVNDRYAEMVSLPTPQNYEKNKYALAIGRSNRDYDFLINAWAGVNYPLVIISDTYEGTTNNSSITILRNVAGDESKPWIANCGLMIVPIDVEKICSGDTVLLTAMSLKKKIVVTSPSTLAEMYIVDGSNALLAPKEYTAFRKIIHDALYEGKYRDLGEKARASFLANYSRANMGKQLTEAMKVAQRS